MLIIGPEEGWKENAGMDRTVQIWGRTGETVLPWNRTVFPWKEKPKEVPMTRGHWLDVRVRGCRRNLRKIVFTQRTVEIWSTLLMVVGVKTLRTLQTFSYHHYIGGYRSSTRSRVKHGWVPMASMAVMAEGPASMLHKYLTNPIVIAPWLASMRWPAWDSPAVDGCAVAIRSRIYLGSVSGIHIFHRSVGEFLQILWSNVC